MAAISLSRRLRVGFAGVVSMITTENRIQTRATKAALILGVLWMTSTVVLAAAAPVPSAPAATPSPTATPTPTPSATPSPTPPPTPSPTPVAECSPEFRRAYFNTLNESQNAEMYVRAGQTPPPNLSEAAITCAKLQQRFNGIMCSLPGEDTEPRYDDFAPACERIIELYAKVKGEPISIEAIPPGKVNEIAPIYKVELSRLKLTVKAGEQLQYAVTEGTKVVAIKGQVMSYPKSIDVDAHTRCMFTHDKGVVPTKLIDNSVLQLIDAVESYTPGFQRLKLITDEGRLTILCISDNNRVHQINDLLSAFSPLLSIEYR